MINIEEVKKVLSRVQNMTFCNLTPPIDCYGKDCKTCDFGEKLTNWDYYTISNVLYDYIREKEQNEYED